MINKELAEKIIAEIPSASLREAIKAQNWQFPDRDLFLIAAKYCRPLKTRWELLDEVIAQADEAVSEWAKRYLAYEKRQKDKFCEEDEKCVYVTRFLYQHSWDDDRVFKNFDKALKYCKAELDDDNDYQCAKIKKQLLGEYVEDWSDWQGDCELDQQGRVLDFGYVDDEEKTCVYDDEGFRDCENCKEPCVDDIEPNLPRFLNNYDIISYMDYYHGEIVYGFVPFELIDGNTVYVTSMKGELVDCYMDEKPLDIPEGIGGEFKNEMDYLCFAQHEHIELSEIEKVEYKDLPEKYQKIYDKLSAEFKKLYD